MVVIDLFLPTFYGELGTGCYLLKNWLNKAVLMKDFSVIIRD